VDFPTCRAPLNTKGFRAFKECQCISCFVIFRFIGKI
jgi:hypothetical protein